MEKTKEPSKSLEVLHEHIRIAGEKNRHRHTDTRQVSDTYPKCLISPGLQNTIILITTTTSQCLCSPNSSQTILKFKLYYITHLLKFLKWLSCLVKPKVLPMTSKALHDQYILFLQSQSILLSYSPNFLPFSLPYYSPTDLLIVLVNGLLPYSSALEAFGLAVTSA